MPLSSRVVRQQDKWWKWIVAVVVAVNAAALLFYQHSLHGDFPFQDEWGYVDRLQHLSDTGLWDYLFGSQKRYSLPVQMFVWYLFYAWTHLNIVAIRYAGAILSTLLAIMACVLLYLKSERRSWLTWLVIVYAPFLICSFNHWASYDQSIESVMEPLFVGVALAACWVAEGTMLPRMATSSTLLCLALGALGAFIGPAGLAILPAVAVANLFLQRRLHAPALVLGIAGLALILWYLVSNTAVPTVGQRPGLNLHDIWSSLDIGLGLTGNAVLYPVRQSQELFTRVVGGAILLAQAVALAVIFRLPADSRRKFMLPLALSICNALICVEILFTRFNPSPEFTPRYSLFMLAGPIGALFYVDMLADTKPWMRRFAVATLVLMTSATIFTDQQILRALPYTVNSFARIRQTLMSLHTDPNPAQQREMFVSAGLLPVIYPGRLFLEQQHLAMYRSGAFDPLAPLVIDAYGPKSLSANPNGVTRMKGGPAIWIRLNRDPVGSAHVVIDGEQLDTSNNGKLVTAALPAALIIHPGQYRVYVLESYGTRSVQSNPVDIVIR